MYNIGSSKHFTTDLKGTETTAVQGSNLIHIKKFTDELNNLLSASNTVAVSSAVTLYIDNMNLSAQVPYDFANAPIDNTTHNTFGTVQALSTTQLVGLGLT